MKRTSKIILALVTAATVAASVAVAVPAVAANPTTFVYAGDSLTAQSNSWLYQNTNASFVSQGGFARSGATSGTVLNGLNQTTFPTGQDVAVIEVGSNDVNQQVPTDDLIANIDAIQKRLAAKHTVVIALPPANAAAPSNYGTNRQVENSNVNPVLAAHTMAKGWLWADPYAIVRNGDGTYTAGATDDGVHPNTATYKNLVGYFNRVIQQAEVGAK